MKETSRLNKLMRDGKENSYLLILFYYFLLFIQIIFIDEEEDKYWASMRNDNYDKVW